MIEKKNLTPEEKLEYIYEYVKSEKKNNIIKLIVKSIFRLFLLLYFLYTYFILWPEVKTNYIEPILKPFWIQSFSVPEFKKFFSNFSSSTWTKSNEDWIQIWDTWIKLDQSKIDQIKKLIWK